MSEAEYDRIAVERPDLRLPRHWQLSPDFRTFLFYVTPEDFIAARVVALIARDHPDKPRVEDTADCKIV